MVKDISRYIYGARDEAAVKARREANAAWRAAHPNESKAVSAAWRAAHPNESKAVSAAWRAAHPNEIKANRTIWRAAYPNKVKASNIKYANTEKGRIAQASASAKYAKTVKGKTVQAKRKRNLGFDPLNKPFPNSHGHHITESLVIYMPASMHNSIRHNIHTGKNMDKINTLALNFWKSQEEAWKRIEVRKQVFSM